MDKLYISNSLDIYSLVTGENDKYYICGNTMFPKQDVVEDYYPLDDMENILHLHIVPFINY